MRGVSRYHARAACAGATRAELPQMSPNQRPVIVKPPQITRTPAEPPVPAPIEHSSAYLLRTSKHKEHAEAAAAGAAVPAEQAFDGNALDWMLQKADKSLEKVEHDPPVYAKSLYDLSRGPVGQAASQGAAAAAKVTVEVGTQALKAAAPVGKWVFTQGFKAAAGAMAQGLKSWSKKNDRSKDTK